MKIVSIVGKKNSGKTSLTMKIIQELTKRGYNVASIKHSHHSMEMDKKNTDTWRHKNAGSKMVVGVGSTTFFNSSKEHDLNRILYLLKHFDNYDYVIIEGYKNYNYPKIITSDDVEDEYTISKVDSFTVTDEEVSELADLIEQRTHDIVDTLFANNCGYNNGEAIARDLRQNKLKQKQLDETQAYLSVNGNVVGLNRFVSCYLKENISAIVNTLNLKDYGVDDAEKIEVIIPQNPQKQTSKSKIQIMINNQLLNINEFTSDIVTNTIKSMISSLKTSDNIKNIEIGIENIDENLINAEISVKINSTNLKINDFTQKILKETIYATIKSLKIPEEIHKLKITIKE